MGDNSSSTHGLIHVYYLTSFLLILYNNTVTYKGNVKTTGRNHETMELLDVTPSFILEMRPMGKRFDYTYHISEQDKKWNNQLYDVDSSGIVDLEAPAEIEKLDKTLRLIVRNNIKYKW